MGYINRDDALKIISESQLQQLEIGQPTLIDDLSETAEAYITNRISDMYDLETEFAKVGNDRDGQLKQIALAITLYYAFQNVNSDQISEIRVKAYDSAVDTLSKSQKGELYFKGIERNEPNAGRTMRFGEDEFSSFKSTNF